MNHKGREPKRNNMQQCAAKKLRLRYVIGLSAIAFLVTASFITMQRVVSEQDNYSAVINLAGHQAGLANRIAFFTSLMATTKDESEFLMAKAQVGRSLNRMKEAFVVLRTHTSGANLPFITNENLDRIYDDPRDGINQAMDGFWSRAEVVYNSDMQSLTPKSAAYIYLTTFGPHVLEPMLDAAVDEYQRIGNAAINRIERLELIIWVTAIFALVLEALFIFHPLERSINLTIGGLRSSVRELTATRERLENAQQLALLGDWELSISSGKMVCSEQLYAICGCSSQSREIRFHEAIRFIHPEDRRQILASLRCFYQTGETSSLIFRILREDGSERQVFQRTVMKRNSSGEVASLAGTIQDITERTELHNRLEKLAHNIPGFIYKLHISCDNVWSVPYISTGVLETCGITPEEVAHSPRLLTRLMLDSDVRRIVGDMHQMSRNLQKWRDCFRLQHKQKGEIWIETQATPERLYDGSTLWYGYGSDITDRKCSEDKIKQLALYDPLTGLANRRLLNDRLVRAMTTAERNLNFGAVLMIDMDNFKTLNDTQGHDAGDAFLIETSRRLAESVRSTDTISRLGGDEFVVILESLGEDEQQSCVKAMYVAEKMRKALAKPHYVGKDRSAYYASASIGVAMFRNQAQGEVELLKQADVAMFEAKEMGRNRSCLYSEDRQVKVNARTSMISNLRQACTDNEFLVYYQPQVDIYGRIRGAEALIRWFPANGAPVSPGEFIPIAEETGLILPIGEWVLKTVCNDIETLQLHNVQNDFSMSVNISGRQFSDEYFFTKVKSIVDSAGICYRQLKFELTETCLIKDIDRATKILGQLRQTGIHLELDDFGTGYSSLNALKLLPLDTLKLDSSLVHGLNEDERGLAILRAAIAMGKALSLNIIAEGVETAEQRDLLIKEGCDILQGYLFAKPMPLNDLIHYLRTNNSDIYTTSPRYFFENLLRPSNQTKSIAQVAV